MKSSALSKNKLKTQVVVHIGLYIALSVILKLVFEIYIPLAGFPALRINFTSIPIILSGMLLGPIPGLITGALSDIMCFIIKPGGAYFPLFTISSALAGCIPGLLMLWIRKNPKRNYQLMNVVFILMLSLTGVFFLIQGGFVTLTEGVVYYGEEPVHWLAFALCAALVFAYIFVPMWLLKKEKNTDNLYSVDKILFLVSVTQLVTSLIINTWALSVLYGQSFMVFLPPRIITNIIMIPLFTLITAGLMKLLPEKLMINNKNEE
jgi:ECF transporter S component (folate family)